MITDKGPAHVGIEDPTDTAESKGRQIWTLLEF